VTEVTDLTISAVVCTVGRPGVLRAGLESLERCVPAPHEIVVVDGDGSARATAEERQASGRRPAVRYLRTERGLTHQRNRGLAAAGGDVVAFFDDDARPASDVFAKLEAAYRDPSVVGVTGRVVEPGDHVIGGRRSLFRRLVIAGPPGTFTLYGYPRRYSGLDVAVDVEIMQGCFMTARRDVAAAIGFDEQLSGYALAEDEDFSYRLSRQGRIRYLPDAVVAHDNAGFAGRDRRAFNRQVVRNRAYLFRKNFPQTRRARAEFGALLTVLFAHRLLNRDLAGARGILEGSAELWRGSR